MEPARYCAYVGVRTIGDHEEAQARLAAAAQGRQDAIREAAKDQAKAAIESGR